MTDKRDDAGGDNIEASRDRPGASSDHNGVVIAFRPRDRQEPLLRTVLGAVLREERLDQGRTLVDVAERAAISLPYLSEVERGQKEVSSTLLRAITAALEVETAEILERCVSRMRFEARAGVVTALAA